MAATTKNASEVTEEIMAAAKKIQFEPGDDISKVIRFRIIPSGAGNDKTCFTTWFFSGGDIRHIAAYAHYILWLAEHDPSFTLDQLKEMTRDWIRQPAEFSGYCGFDEIWALVQDMITALKTVDTKEEFIPLVNSIWTYASNMNAWLYHYIPWGIGYMFPTRDEKYFEEGLRYARMK
jgi:hypothetical protein